MLQFLRCFNWLFISQIAGFNGLSDALKRLDFRSAVHDGRRFHYICKLLDLLITEKLSMLSGCAQKVLFAMLEEVAYQGKTYVAGLQFVSVRLGTTSQVYQLESYFIIIFLQFQPVNKICTC